MTRRAQHGFTLVEFVVAMALFAISALGLTQFAAQSYRHTSDNRAATGAVLLAQQELEDLRSLDYVDIVTRSSTGNVAGQGYGITTVVADDTPAAGMKQINVTVNWTGAIGPRSYVVQTILTAIN